MSHQPTQRSLLQQLVSEMQATVTELQAQTIEIAAQSADIATQTIAIAAMQADIAAQASDIVKTKQYQRWQNEYLAGSSADLSAIEAGTHTFPSP